MKTKKVLFIINGLGLGNSTRCAAIVSELALLKYEIDIATSSNGLKYFYESADISNLFEFKELLYGKHKGKLSILRTAVNLPALVALYLKNVFSLKKILKEKAYDAIIFDSDYTVLGLLWQRRPLLIAINNAVTVVNECENLSDIPRGIRWQLKVEKMDYWFHKIIPDLVICPTIKKINLLSKKTKCTAPIIRRGLRVQKKNSEVKNILVMLSGSQFGTTTEFLNQLESEENIKITIIGKEDESHKNIKYLGKIYNNKDLIMNADMLVINAGFSAVSEAIILKIPAVVIPIENHAEQFINAKIFESFGLGLIAHQGNAHNKIRELIFDYKKFLTAHDKQSFDQNAAQHAAEVIDSALARIL